MKTVVVIGAGPAGLSAALWLKQLGMTPVVLERQSVTGGMQRFNFLANDWVLGQVGQTGVGVADNFDKHIQQQQIDVRLGVTVKALQLSDLGLLLSLSDGDEFEGIAMVIASGTRYVGREILSSLPGFSQIETRYLIDGPYAFLNVGQLSSQHVVVVGAGDNAFENASMLLEQGCRVSMISRSVPKAQKIFLERVMPHTHFRLFTQTEITAFLLDDNRLSLALKQRDELLTDVDRIHVLAGYRPNTDMIGQVVSDGLVESLACDDDGFLMTDLQGRTNIARIYAAGDVCNVDFPCVVSAVAAGALVAKSISRDCLVGA